MDVMSQSDVVKLGSTQMSPSWKISSYLISNGWTLAIPVV